MKTLDIAIERLKNQRLDSPDLKKAVDVVRWLGAVQAQDYYAAKWALGIRMRTATDQGLEKAFGCRRNTANSRHASHLAFCRARGHSLVVEADRAAG